MRVIVLGAKGNLGHQLASQARKAGLGVTAIDRDEADLTDFTAAYRLVRDGHYAAVFNCVAWNDVEGAESPENRAAVWQLNAELPGVLAAAAAEAGSTFVHYSTDYVFAGDEPCGYQETDQPNPLSEYGRSKLAGEQAALAAGGQAHVCRTSKLFGPAGPSALAKRSFVDIMLELAATKPELKLVHEEVGCPTYTVDLAEASLRLIDGEYPAGLYHLVNDGPGVTWYEFAEEFFGLAGVVTPRQPVGSELFPQKAARPKHAFLKNTRFPALRPRVEALRHYLHQHVKVKLAA
jgi:dTDP-4-dehydrorhamnose reductase